MNETSTTALARFGGRKFLFAMSTLMACSILVWFDKVTDSIFSTVMLATIAIFTAGNVYQKVASTPKAIDAKV